MKLLAALVAVFVSAPTFAAEETKDFLGELVAPPAAVKVLQDDGTTATYVISPELNTGYISRTNNMILLTQNGVSAMCGDYLGQLAEDFRVTIKTKSGELKTGSVHAAAGKDRVVSVFGMCRGDTNELTELQIDVRSGAGVEIQ